MKSIEFSAPMMLALLRKQKTMTRRRMKPQPEKIGGLWRWKDTAWCEGRALTSDSAPVDHARYQVGDLAWVREPLVSIVGWVAYAADETEVIVNGAPILWRWKRSTLPARYCPREASRATVRITSLKAERVQDITEEDAIREGLTDAFVQKIATEVAREGGISGCTLSATEAFSCIWEKLHGTGAWECNDWVFAYGFELVEC